VKGTPVLEARLVRLADTVAARRRLVIGTWACLIVALAWFSLHQSDRLSSGGFEIPGSQAARADAALRDFPGFSSATYSIVVSGAKRANVEQRVGRARAIAARDRDIRVGPAHRYERGRAVLLPLAYVGKSDGAIDTATRLRDVLVETTPGTKTRLIGAPASWSEFHELSKRQLAISEAIGMPLILAILLIGFGTLLAATAPLALGFASVFVTGALIYALSRVVPMSIFVTNMTSMIGIGVAVDYSVFIVSRFRRELNSGAEVDEALRRALRTSGAAVVFSGTTVVASLAALYIIDANAVRSMATGAILVVGVSVVASLTLLPALVGVAGARIERFRVSLPWRTSEEGDVRFWRRWTERVMSRPLTALAAAAALMTLVAAPAFSLQTYNRGLEELPKDSEVRAATEEVQRFAGPGITGPVHVIDRSGGSGQALSGRLRAVRGVAFVGPVVRGAGSGPMLIDAILDTDPESIPARATYDRIRAVAPNAIVGGATAFDLAVEDAVFGGLWGMLALLLAISYVVLLIVLRSVLLPLKAIVMNLLSVGAAYGVLVAVFQWGWFDWVGFDSPGYVATIVPPLLLAITVGLSTDYEIFLLTRIREHYVRGGDGTRAVANGLADSARVITSAALIMVAVFAAFAIAGSPTLRELGIGLAVAIALDATVVRLVMVPAAMRLLGDWNWWLPRPVARFAFTPMRVGDEEGNAASLER
jgi:uncharacterized membrane protein YdfJ with MMPL/SSD domain